MTQPSQGRRLTSATNALQALEQQRTKDTKLVAHKLFGRKIMSTQIIKVLKIMIRRICRICLLVLASLPAIIYLGSPIVVILATVGLNWKSFFLIFVYLYAMLLILLIHGRNN